MYKSGKITLFYKIIKRRLASRRRPDQIVSATATEAEEPDLDGDGSVDLFLLRS